jgi:hypothetical protein
MEDIDVYVHVNYCNAQNFTAILCRPGLPGTNRKRHSPADGKCRVCARSAIAVRLKVAERKWETSAMKVLVPVKRVIDYNVKVRVKA